MSLKFEVEHRRSDNGDVRLKCEIEFEHRRSDIEHWRCEFEMLDRTSKM